CSGLVTHKLANRKQRLEALRGLAINQLLTAAGSDQPLLLPGPEADDWLSWAWSLPEAELQALVDSLQRDLPGLVDFVGECAREWWRPSQKRAAPEAPPAPEPLIAPVASLAEPPTSPPLAAAGPAVPGPEEGERPGTPLSLPGLPKTPAPATPDIPGPVGNALRGVPALRSVSPSMPRKPVFLQRFVRLPSLPPPGIQIVPGAESP